MGQLHLLDYSAIAAYFGLVVVIAVWVTIRERRKRAEGSEDYFLAGKSVGWFLIGASLFASNIGSEHLVGLTGSGAKGDMVAAQFEIIASLILILLGWLFVPFYLKSGVYTMPEFLERRYDSRSRKYLSIISIIAYVITKISATIFAGAIVFQEILDVPFWSGATLVVVLTGLYTIFGGLRVVLYTDMMQMFVLVFGSLAVIWYGYDAISDIAATNGSTGWGFLNDSLQEAQGAEGKSKYFSLWRSMSDADYPWTGILFGAPILGVWYWCTDQFIVQRVLSAKNLSHARKGALFAGFMKLLPLFLFVVPGILAYTLFLHNPDLLPMKDGSPDYDAALPAMVMTYLPAGFKGLVAAGMLAALMSSLSSVFNSSSTLFTIDFYKKSNPNASEKTLVRVGQTATVVLVVTGLLWIPFMESLINSEGIFKYLQSVQAYIAPPIAAAFLLGLFYKRLNGAGAYAALWTGFVLGMGRLALEFICAGFEDGTAVWNVAPDGAIAGFLNISFLHYAIFLFVVCSIVLVLVSRRHPAPSAEKLQNVTYEKSTAAERGPGWNTDRLLTILLVVLVLMVWITFSPWGIA